MLTGFIVGVMIGAIIGIFIAALLHAAHDRGDND